MCFYFETECACNSVRISGGEGICCHLGSPNKLDFGCRVKKDHEIATKHVDLVNGIIWEVI